MGNRTSMNKKQNIFAYFVLAIFVLASADLCAAQASVDIQPQPPNPKTMAMLSPDRLSGVDVLPSNFQPGHASEKFAAVTSSSPDSTAQSNDRFHLNPDPNIALEELEMKARDLGKRSPDVVRSLIAQADQLASLSALNIATDTDALRILQENSMLESTEKSARNQHNKDFAKIRTISASLKIDYQKRDKAYRVCTKALALAKQKEIIAPGDPLTCTKYGPSSLDPSSN